MLGGHFIKNILIRLCYLSFQHSHIQRAAPLCLGGIKKADNYRLFSVIWLNCKNQGDHYRNLTRQIMSELKPTHPLVSEQNQQPESQASHQSFPKNLHNINLKPNEHNQQCLGFGSYQRNIAGNARCQPQSSLTLDRSLLASQ